MLPGAALAGARGLPGWGNANTWAPNAAFPGPFGDKWTPTNVNRSRAYGFEAGVRYDPSRNITMEAGYTRTMAKEEVDTITRRAKVPVLVLRST